MSGPRLLVLVGATAAGKTAAAIALGREFNAEVVNADSVQVYRGLDIGSAKPTPAERASLPHHLVDVAGPAEQMSAARFAEMAGAAIAGIHQRGRRVLVAGGTGLYIKALLWGLAPAPPVDPDLRLRLREDWDQQGPAALHARLGHLDPLSAQRLPPGDRQRVLRALEVTLQTGQPFSRRLAEHGFKQPRYAHALLGLERPRAELNQRIEARCRQMWQGGLLEETRALLAAGVPPQAMSLQSLGYRQALGVILAGQDPEEALGEMIQKTRAYAKRQLTWFRGLQGIKWCPADDLTGLADQARSFWLEEAPLP
ncbi:MAG: tRNA (adenosine(37)-N6)-dimethylallyltransferase MiaA [Desulfarculus sp.]|nr:tRNA (adenosine(37)-N6)-dimethylallyltransferase MiaA [Desulfarculus sp.]